MDDWIIYKQALDTRQDIDALLQNLEEGEPLPDSLLKELEVNLKTLVVYVIVRRKEGLPPPPTPAV